MDVQYKGATNTFCANANFSVWCDDDDNKKSFS